ncbi:MAG: AAA family ATPase [Elusimicrobia bacterium CG_4_10_14_3_um_filter_49_12_50_7]|nr:MAG: AAA family ATPase [Elusimicrobia bacterium CG03_land_8_20_14_0_80_50_18]PIX15420.1 MAG: AAA family ATPase [Elusimicrobia bacterium CG_4_8_14_3_um_filter_50_9]PIY16717.1 MAG: AAA family ATPase [Elusimicrobia bacterium CG_4_10_14_3_um_filter_49_12_50_7]
MRDTEKVKSIADKFELIRGELSKVIVGQDDVIKQLLTALFARGHSLIVGVPGLAKTMMVSSLARVLDLKFSRIQFTPDLMPSDIAGTDVIEEDMNSGRKNFRFIKGPVFANIILADEINRTPPKTQAALLEAMQEHQITAAGKTYRLDDPFFVIGTQNPIEQEGTYPLPEAQLDRFFTQINIFYPSESEEREIVLRTTSPENVKLKTVISGDEIRDIQEFARTIPVTSSVLEYAVRLVKMSRHPDGYPEIIKWLSWGAGPRASQSLVLAGKINAALDGRFSVEERDIMAVAYPVLRHRLIVNFSAEAEGISTDDIIKDMLERAPEK